MFKKCSLLGSLALFLFNIFQLKVQYFLQNATIYFLYFSATLVTPDSMSCVSLTTLPRTKGSLRRGYRMVARGCSGWLDASRQEPPAMFRAQGQRTELMKPNLFSGDGDDVDQRTGTTGSSNDFNTNTRHSW